jgi:hypothetical protein
MQTVRRGFSRKSHLYAGLAARRISSVRNILRAGRINFGEGTVAGIWEDVPAYNLIVGI